MYKHPVLLSVLLIFNATLFSMRDDARRDAPGLNDVFGVLLASQSKAIGRGFTEGMMEGLQTPDMSKRIGEGLEEILKEMLKAFPRALEDGSIAQGFDAFGDQLKKATAEGSHLDQGLRQMVKMYTTHVNKVVTELVHKNLIKAGAIGVGTAASYFVARYSIPLAFKMLKRALMRPKLIISSSKKSIFQQMMGLFSEEALRPMVFTPKLEERLNTIVKVTSTIQKKINSGNTNVKYRNLMLYGPPGTGKTLFAMELAKRSGLEYVCMSGSSFSKFKDGEGIEALDELFAWANKSKGLLIFIDEAETFLSKRDNMDPQSKAYQLLNNFLNYTGERSNKFMIVFATNHKDALDSAMYRRIDDLVELPLPGYAERIRILELYKSLILMDVKQNGHPFVESVKQVLTPALISDIATRTKGLSAGDLEGIINAIKTDTDILEPALVTKDLVNKVVEYAIEKHHAFTGGQPLGYVEN